MQQSTIELDLRNNKIDELKETSLSFRLTCPPLKKKQSEQNNTYLAREQVMLTATEHHLQQQLTGATEQFSKNGNSSSATAMIS